MGALLVETHTKGFTALSQQHIADVYDKDIAPGLVELYEALDVATKEGPTKISVTVHGDTAHGERKHTVNFVVHNITEMQEILQWAIGK